ncbi:MAG: PIN domain-containing protein [Candidatus Bathyarchaeota archaeon]|nr:PIN domain-containing protein [Candidatus Bathyarchaeota archaeon]
MNVFLDTSAIVAVINTRDASHAEAADVMSRILRREIPLTRFVTTEYVLNETLTFINCTLKRHELAVSTGEAILNSNFIEIFRIDDEVFRRSWELFRRSEELSFADCASFALMEHLGIDQAFTMDDHFRRMGFKLLP